MATSSVALAAVSAGPRVFDMLKRLHAESEAQEHSLSQRFFYVKRILGYYLFGVAWTAAADDFMRDKYVSLEADKCHFMYLVARSIGACNIVEAGTSFGVSTIYLALAVGQNVAALKESGNQASGKIIATEKEPTKAAKAWEHWKLAGDEVEPWIELRVGDLLETLTEEGVPDEIDLLLLDIWTNLALPTLEIIKPKLRRGAVILADNTSIAKPLYKEFLDYLHNPDNGFKTTTLPFSGGLEMAVYLP